MAPKILELPASERPRERLRRFSPDALSTTELLAVVLGAGATGRSAVDVAGRLLADFGGSLREMGRAEPAELERTGGVGPARGGARGGPPRRGGGPARAPRPPPPPRPPPTP
ncbi:MAG: DNA repair protein, partial [Gemmatimonadales bacterium]|nr:DNA repair protein [Gemmatimonadales bacterium]